MLTRIRSTLRLGWVASALAIAIGVVPTAWVIGVTWRTLSAVELALPYSNFDAIRELNIMIRDISVLETTVELARIAPDSPASEAKLWAANDAAYIRFVRMNYSEVNEVFPELPPVRSNLRHIIAELDRVLAAGRPYDSAALAGLSAMLREAHQSLSKYYYSFGNKTDTTLREQHEILSQFRVGLASFLGLLCMFSGLFVILLLNRLSVIRRIRYLSNHDVLTGLPNRAWFVRTPSGLRPRPRTIGSSRFS